MRLWGSFSLVLFVLSNAGIAFGSPGELFGFGARSQSLAGTGVSHSRGYAASYLNPARLDAAGRPSFSIGFQAQLFRLGLRGFAQHEPETGSPLPSLPDGKNNATQAALIGLSVPLPLGGVLKQRFALGLAVSTPGTTLVRVRILNPRRPQFPLLSTRAETLNFNFGLGAQLTESLSLGIGTALLASLDGQIQIRAGGSDGQVTSATDDELRVVHAPLVGLAWQATPQLSLGAVWREALRSEFGLNVNIEDLGQVVVPPLNITGLAQADPAQLQIESALALEPWLFTVGVSYKYWSEFDHFKEATVLCPPEQPTCGAPVAEVVHFTDTLVPRLAAAYVVTLAPGALGEARAGYFLEPSPLGTGTPDQRLFDTHRHVITAGYGVSLTNAFPLSVNISAQWHLLAAREYPLTEDRTQAFATASGHIWAYALDLEVPF